MTRLPTSTSSRSGIPQTEAAPMISPLRAARITARELSGVIAKAEVPTEAAVMESMIARMSVRLSRTREDREIPFSQERYSCSRRNTEAASARSRRPL